MESGIINAENLSIGYRRRVVAEDLNFCIRKGSVTSLLGRNGAGKSTLLKTLTGEIPAIRGVVCFNGVDISGLSLRERARLMSVVSTESTGASGLRVSELVALGRDPYTNFWGSLDADDKRIVDKSMRLTGIDHKRDAFVCELSDGERQKALLARSLAQHTPVIVLDEPFTYIDVASRISIMRLLCRLCREEGKTIIMSSHEIGEALRMSDVALIFDIDNNLRCGSPAQLIADGAVDSIFSDPDVRFDRDSLSFVENTSRRQP